MSLAVWTAGTWNKSAHGEKVPGLVCEVERHQLDIVVLTSKHNVGSGTKLLDRG